MDLQRLPERPDDWDVRIRDFSSKTLFHESAWLDYVRAIRPRSVLEYYEIRRNDRLEGYFCVVRVRRAFLSVFGSPLPGTGMYLGPLVSDGVNQAELGEALLRLCHRGGIACLELANNWLDPDIMIDLGFTSSRSVTHLCPLGDGKRVWSAMKGVCRTRIRKAMKSGLQAELTDDVSAVEDFYRFYSGVLRLKGRRPDYTIDHPRALQRHLGPADRLFSVRVTHQGKVIGTGFYPHDDTTMYFWDGASDPSCLRLCPNELLHWTAMQEAIRRGLTMFNMGGAPRPSRFTRKFGGQDVPYSVYRRSFVPFLDTARALYHSLAGGRPRLSRDQQRALKGALVAAAANCLATGLC